MFPIILLFADTSSAGFQVVQQFRVAVEQAKEVKHGGHRFGLPAFIAGKRVFTAPSELCRFHLGELQFLANTGQFGCFCGIHPVTMNKTTKYSPTH
jgi:hypothetical protein